MNIWHFSDTHGTHRKLSKFPEADIAIFSGDCSNPRNAAINYHEVIDFIDWYKDAPYKIKIFVAGNHDTSIEASLITKRNFEEAGIYYLENESIQINGIKIWGSPFTPSFGNWAFMRARHKMIDIWDMIPEDVDILVTHGPPKGILDYAPHNEASGNAHFQCGCVNLAKQLKRLKNLKVHMFGHIHNNKSDKFIRNSGMFYDCETKVVFSNGTCVRDGDMGVLYSVGNIINIRS